jgi:hypothetical protein
MSAANAHTDNASTLPVGVRAVTGDRAGRLTWAETGTVDTTHLTVGSRVLVRDGEQELLAEVIVVPGQLLESPPLADLPSIVRVATDADAWPTMPDRAGRALLDSLGLPPELLEPSDR